MALLKDITRKAVEGVDSTSALSVLAVLTPQLGAKVVQKLFS